MGAGKKWCEDGFLITGATRASGPAGSQSPGAGRLASTSPLDLRVCYQCAGVAIPGSSILGKFHLESDILGKPLGFPEPAQVKGPLDLSTLLVFSTHLNFMDVV